MRTKGETNTPLSWLALICIVQAQRVGRGLGAETLVLKEGVKTEVSPLGSPCFHTLRVYYPLLAKYNSEL